MTAFTAADWFALLGHFLSLSLLSVGGAISVAPDMHRFLVDRQGWLTDPQFNASIAIAQAAPGPNVLFVALMGWNVGLNAGGGIGAGPMAWLLGFFGLMITMVGIMLPSTTLTYFATRWGHRNRTRREVRAFKQGMAPVVVGLLIATGWVLAGGNQSAGVPAWHLWLLGCGTALGAVGFV